MTKGTIVLVPFPFTDLSGQKVRPALVVAVSKGGEDCITAFISSVKSKKSRIFDVSVVASRSNGLKANSVIDLEKLATLEKKIMLGEIGKLESPYVVDVYKKLKQMFDI